MNNKMAYFDYFCCHCNIIVFSIFDNTTFDAVEDWVNFAKKHSPKKTPVFLVAHKNRNRESCYEGDLNDLNIEVTSKEIQKLIDKIGAVKYFECKDYQN